MKTTLFSALVAAVLISALLVVYARHQSRVVFVQIQTLESERDALNEEWSRLQLEQSTQAMASRIEGLAREQLDMRSPKPEQLVLVPQ
ncbi:cell division protein FtsL [Methylohalomonas lacus]|uniref:Cell division protein FtsL n=1 Tax=Methylohalomonas lacus TaxID=398773 RepID=A0AAE3L0W0_9GAMM|nr:cell division protein FtsL [Methylohalomonas lacus]MCS3902246.1 cell division protein FtsL [Methylohalomonas lacus]